MKISIHLLIPSLVTAMLVMGGCASSLPKLSQEQIINQYPQVASLKTAVNTARADGAEYLAPESYNTALNALNSAMLAAQNNKTDDANEAASKGLKVIDKMTNDTAKSKQLLSEVLSARDRAMKADVATLQREKLADMDKDLIKTCALIEEGDIEKAKQRRPELIKGYAQLELTALKKGTAELAKSAIASAKQQGADKYAPKTIAQAEDSLALAISILEADRTQTDKADAQAIHARWLAEQSAAITETIKDFDRRDYAMEDVVLWHQAQLSIVNEPIGGQLPFNQSSDAVVHGLKNEVLSLKNEILTLQNSIDELKSAEIDYSKKLEMTQKERLAMEAQDRAVKKQFETIQAMFTANEANVYRQRQNVLISAHGFQFPSGVSEIQTDNFPLMKKIISAIKIFPNSRIEVSGHTDSTGADTANKLLSQARAENVSKFLSEVGEISADRITATGYGMSRPVATNKTAAGRAENRRVEIKIINE